MAEQPIIFSAAMVEALLAGRKTQTRRFLGSAQKNLIGFTPAVSNKHWIEQWQVGFDFGPGHPQTRLATVTGKSILCRFAPVGTTLWVREVWCLNNPEFEHQKMPSPRPIDPKTGRWPYYRATEPDVEGTSGKSPWRSPIHMPKWASRLSLTVTNIRVERLQDITEADAQAEGLDHDEDWWYGALHEVKEYPKKFKHPIRAYQSCWNSLHGEDNWETNPWVFVISFTTKNFSE